MFKDTGFPFTDCDVATFEAFAIFCGLGIHNTQMYESACEYIILPLYIVTKNVDIIKLHSFFRQTHGQTKSGSRVSVVSRDRIR